MYKTMCTSEDGSY